MVRRSRADALIAPASLDVPFRILGDMIDACALVERARQREEDGDDDGAIADFEHAVTLAIETGDASTVAAAHAGLVRVHFAAGHAQLVDAELERMRATMSSAVAATVRAEAEKRFSYFIEALARRMETGRHLHDELVRSRDSGTE